MSRGTVIGRRVVGRAHIPKGTLQLIIRGPKVKVSSSLSVRKIVIHPTDRQMLAQTPGEV